MRYHDGKGVNAMAANLPFKIGDSVYDHRQQKGTVVDFKQVDVSDPSNGKFSYKVSWEAGGTAWMTETAIYKKSFFQRLMQKFK